MTRYLINDVAVNLGVPLVSASALKTEGQLSVLGYKDGPCYRCLFPTPPPPDSVLSCGDGGILGPVVGVMGVFQATEAIKVLTGAYEEAFKPFLTIYSAYSFPPMRTVAMRRRKPNCFACGNEAALTRDQIENGSIDYVAFCGSPTRVGLAPTERITVEVRYT